MIKPNETKFPMTTSNSSLRRSILQADPLLSRYDPLPRILCVDRFTEGMQAWQAYFPDYAMFVIYLLMVVVLLTRPQGLFGVKRA